MALRHIASTLAAACVLGYGFPATAGPNPTDSDGYIMNWTGMIVPQFNGTTVPNPSPTTLMQQISMSVTESMICSAVQNAILSAGGSAVKSFDGCTALSSPLELRGKMLGANELGLKIITNNVSFSFTANQFTDPKFNVTMNLEIDTGLAFSGSIDGAVPSSTTPISALPVSIQISNIDPTTSNVFANLFGGSFKTTIENKISQAQGPNGGLMTQLNSSLASENIKLHGDAVTLTNLLVKLTDPSANDFYFLAVDIDPQQNFDINFIRNGVSASVPNNCKMGSTGYAIVTATCYTMSSNGTITFDQLDQMMLFRFDPATSTPGNPVFDLADDGMSNSWDTPPPRFVAPFLEDLYFQSIPKPPKTATYKVCAQNLFGGNCGPDQTVTLNLTVPPVVVPGPPACGPNSHPYRQCQAVLVNPAATQPGLQAHQP